VSVVANVALNLDTRGVPQKLRDVQGQAQQTERAFDSLGNTVGRLVKAYAAFQAIKLVFTQAAEVESQAKSLQVLTGSAQKATQIIKQLQDLGAVTPFTSSELIDAAKRLQAFGVATENVVDTTRRLADVSGATGAELQGLVTAYGQVQAKGRLQGEELLQFQERGVALQKILKDEYKLSGDEFQKALQKGQIGAASVEYALKKLTDAGGKYANGAIAQSDTLNGKLSTLQDSFQRLAQNIGKFFEPVFKFLIDGVNALIERLNNAQRIGVEAQAYQEANRRTRMRFGPRAANPLDAEVQQYRERLRKSLVTSGMGVAAAPTAPSVPDGAPPALLAPSGGSSKEDDKDAKRAAKERAQLEARIRGIRMETESTKQLSFIRGKIAQAEIAGDQQLAIRLQGEERNQQILQQYQKSLEGVTSEREKQALFSNAQSQIEASGIQTAAELERLQADRTKAIEEAMTDIANQIALEGQLTEEGRRQVEIEQKVQEFKKANKGVTDAQVAAYRLANQELDKTQKKAKAIKAEQQALDALYGGISSQIANGVGGAIDAVTSSTENLGQALANIGQEILQAVSKMLIFYALAQAFGALGGKDGKGIFSHLARAFGGDPTALGFAEGGFVTGPTNALIGEAGESEYVIPASKMRGAMNRYAAGARGSAVIPAGDSEGGMGGTATLAPGAIDVRYTVERINSVDYVTADQFQQGMQQAAQQGAAQGEQRTLRRLQMSTGTRKRLGM